MSMTKKDFIKFADCLRKDLERREEVPGYPYYTVEIGDLADALSALNPRFKRDLWLSYLRGECGPNGGQRKTIKDVDAEVRGINNKIMDGVLNGKLNICDRCGYSTTNEEVDGTTLCESCKQALAFLNR